MNRSLTALFLTLALVGAGCGDDSAGGTDAGRTDSGGIAIDAGAIDGGPGGDGATGTDGGSSMLPDLPVLMGTGGAAVDYACLGMSPTPTGGADTTFDMAVQDFQEDTPTVGVTVQFFFDDVVADSCDAPGCLAATTDMAGLAMAHGAAGSWFAYRILPKMGPTPSTTVVGSVQYHEEIRMGANATGNSVSQATLGLIPTVLGFRRAMGTAIVAGTAWDCMGHEVTGAIVRMFRSDGTEILEGMRQSDPHFRYFDGNSFPSADQPYTNTDGLFADANIPVPGDGSPVRIELWGRLAGQDAPQRLACEVGRVFAETVTIMNLNPLRSDAAAACR